MIIRVDDIWFPYRLWQSRGDELMSQRIMISMFADKREIETDWSKEIANAK
jgi:hypothetical protein